MSLTFCLASMILASRSAGMTLPLEEQSASGQSLKSLVLHFSCINISPLVRAQQDHVLSAEAQSSSGLLDGIVAL